MAENLNDPAMKETEAPPPGILVSGHFRQPYGYFAYRSRGTRDWLITYTLSGRGQYRLQEEVYECGEGDVVLLRPGTPHDYATPKDSVWEFVWAHFVPEPRWSQRLRLPERAPGMIFLSLERQAARSRLLEAFQRLIRYSRDNGELSGLLSLNAMEEIVLLIAQNETRREPLDPRIGDLLDFLSANLERSFTLQELASQVMLSPSRLSHLFKEQTGDSVLEMFLKLRLRHAAQLLRHTTLPVSEVAEKVGFRSPFYFTKQFTSYYGVSPSKYRSGSEGDAR